jgi:hypothetical protein
MFCGFRFQAKEESLMSKSRFLVMVLGSAILPLLWSARVVLGDDPPVADSDSFRFVVEACRVELTELGAKSRFQNKYLYQLTTDSQGEVVSFSRMMDDNPLDRFLRLDQLKCCVEKWTLKPSTKYVLNFTAGTGSETLRVWSLNLCEKVTAS